LRVSISCVTETTSNKAQCNVTPLYGNDVLASSAVTSVQWDWADGSAPGTSLTATHTYAQPGTFFIRVTMAATTADGDKTAAATLRVVVPKAGS
jgi:PKD repeat protein